MKEVITEMTYFSALYNKFLENEDRGPGIHDQ